MIGMLVGELTLAFRLTSDAALSVVTVNVPATLAPSRPNVMIGWLAATALLLEALAPWYWSVS